MAEKNPFTYAYGTSQGRYSPITIRMFDGVNTYTLGHEHEPTFNFAHNDYVQILQNIDLTDLDTLEFSATVHQPEMPQGRDVSGYDESGTWIHTATLKRSEVQINTKPKTWTQIKAPYSITAGDVLRVAIDGGAFIDITFTSPPTYMSALELATTIDAAVNPAGRGFVDLDLDPEGNIVSIESASTGVTASIEVQDYPTPAVDANNHLVFWQKTSAPYPIYGGDDLSAIIAPNANFTEADAGLPLEITDAVTSGNNGTNNIAAIISASIAILKNQITSEAEGFHANILPSIWEFAVYIGSWKGLSLKLEQGTELISQDFAINTSKLSGAYDVIFRLQLIGS